MHRDAMAEFAAGLADAGLPPSRVKRLLRELDEHYSDLVSEGQSEGLSREVAEEQALRRLGRPADLAETARSLPELRSWAFRHPLVALLVYPLTCLAVLPAVPVLAGIAHASQIARWAASVFLSALVTATLFLVLQLAILLS